MKDVTEYLGERVVVPDPQKLNPFGSPPGPHGPGTVVEARPAKYTGGSPMLTVRLDSGEDVRLSTQFVRAS